MVLLDHLPPGLEPQPPVEAYFSCPFSMMAVAFRGPPLGASEMVNSCNRHNTVFVRIWFAFLSRSLRSN